MGVSNTGTGRRVVKKKIGLAGRSGGGKDVIADIICDTYLYRKIAVADGIRDECSDFLNSCLTDGKYLSNPEGFEVVTNAFRDMIWEKPTPTGIRVLLQWYGTEYRRTQNPDYWTNLLANRLDNEDSIVVSDVRTPEEMRVIREAGGEIWSVHRPGVEPVGISNHFTEVALEGATFDRHVENDGTLDDLSQRVDWIMKQC